MGQRRSGRDFSVRRRKNCRFGASEIPGTQENPDVLAVASRWDAGQIKNSGPADVPGTWDIRNTPPTLCLRQELQHDVEIYDLMITCIKRNRLACCKRQNRLVPVNSLDQDVVSLVFENVLSQSSEYYDTLGSLRLVCTSWLEHIDTSPHYWKYVSFDLTNKFLDMIIQRGCGVPLMATHNPPPGRNSEQSVSVLRRLAGLGWPIRSFQVSAPRERITASEINLMKDLFESPAPHLESLEAALWGQATGGVVIDNLFGGHAPNLTTLRLRDLSIRWDTLSFRGLTTLTLEGVVSPQDRAFTVPNLLERLQSFPALESLTVTNVPFSHLEPAAGITTSPGRLRMEYLRELHLRAAPQLIAISIIRRLALPACRNLSVTCRENAVNPVHVAQLIEGVLEIMPPQSLAVRIQRTNWIEVSGEQWNVTSEDRPSWNPTHDNFRRLLIKSLPPGARTRVSKYSMGRDQADRAVQKILFPILHEAFPNLSELSMPADETPALDLLTAPTAHGWLLPQLRTLCLDGRAIGVATLKPVVRMAQARRRAQNTEVNVAPFTTFRTSLRKVDVLSGEAAAVFKQMTKSFDRIECDETPLPFVPHSANTIFAPVSDQRRDFGDADPDSDSEFEGLPLDVLNNLYSRTT